MAYQLNDNIPCGTEACATSKHGSSACNSVDNVLISGIKDIKKGISDIEGKIDNIKLPEIDTTELASKELERFWDVVPEDSEEIISEEDIHAAVEDIWTQTFNS